MKHKWQYLGNDKWKCERCGEIQKTLDEETKCSFGSSWICPKCKGQISAHYTKCPNCGAKRKKSA
jgi:hypothetical protein